jgi:hypothetical protein
LPPAFRLHPAPAVDSRVWVRRGALQELVQRLPEPCVCFSEGVVGRGKAFFEALVAQGQEGMMAKHLAPGLERPMTLAEGGSTVGDFPQDRTQEHQIETGLWNKRLGGVTEDRHKVRNACLLRSNFEPLDHTRLNVDPNRFAPRQNTLRRWKK